MSDIATIFDNEAMRGDYGLDGGLLATDQSLKTAILHSIFSDRRADESDELLPGESPRGWWGDCLADDEHDQYGSRFWTLRREKLSAEVAARAKDILQEALKWLIDDGRLASVEVEVEIERPASLHCLIKTTAPDGRADTLAVTYAWSA